MGGRAVLTWTNAAWPVIYYALIDSNGVLVTPPQIMHWTEGGLYVLNSNGQGNTNR